jgi:hypothetical protein
MNTPRSFPAFAVTFAVVYPVVYLLAVIKNYALFTYHPATEEFGLLVEPPKEGPAMYWYGWIATAVVSALIVGFIVSFVPERVRQRLWSGWSWAVPLCVMLFFGYLLRGYFIR